jgi:hypothetical protein
MQQFSICGCEQDGRLWGGEPKFFHVSDNAQMSMPFPRRREGKKIERLPFDKEDNTPGWDVQGPCCKSRDDLKKEK